MFEDGERDTVEAAVAAGGQRRYVALAQRILGDIEAGRYAVGELLPTEFELTDRFRVSRATVREALRQLQSLGLVSRRPGVGTRVLARTPQRAYTHTLGSIGELVHYAEETERYGFAIDDITADAILARELRCASGQKFLCVIFSRRAAGDEKPLCRSAIYIPETYAAIRDAIPHHAGLLAELITRRFGEVVTEVHQEITAVALTETEAAALASAPGSAGLRIQRWYIGEGGDVFQIAISVYPAERYVYSIRLRHAGPLSHRR